MYRYRDQTFRYFKKDYRYIVWTSRFRVTPDWFFVQIFFGPNIKTTTTTATSSLTQIQRLTKENSTNRTVTPSFPFDHCSSRDAVALKRSGNEKGRDPRSEYQHVRLVLGCFLPFFKSRDPTLESTKLGNKQHTQRTKQNKTNEGGAPCSWLAMNTVRFPRFRSLFFLVRRHRFFLCRFFQCIYSEPDSRLVDVVAGHARPPLVFAFFFASTARTDWNHNVVGVDAETSNTPALVQKRERDARNSRSHSTTFP